MAGNRADKRATAGTQERVFTCPLPALLLFLLTFMSHFSFSQNKTEYDINDPRNPNCPCHQYQKLADEEYNKQQKENLNNVFVNNPQKINDAGNIGIDRDSPRIKKEQENNFEKGNGSSGASGTRKKKKEPGTWIVKKTNRAKLKHSKIRKWRPEVALCYKW